MTDDIDALVLDLVEWVAAGPRAYAEVMDAWRTSCPRLTVWETALDRGLVRRDHAADVGPIVAATPRGLSALREAGRAVRD